MAPCHVRHAMPRHSARARTLAFDESRVFRTGAPRVERLTLRLLQALLAAEGLMIRTRIRKGVRIYRGARPA
jgi:hypothetical protein